MPTLPLRSVPRLNKSLTEVGLGCWQLGSDWGEVSESTALELLGAAYAAGIRFFDTADVYGTDRRHQAGPARQPPYSRGLHSGELPRLD